jgi:hypothetical protein
MYTIYQRFGLWMYGSYYNIMAIGTMLRGTKGAPPTPSNRPPLCARYRSLHHNRDTPSNYCGTDGPIIPLDRDIGAGTVAPPAYTKRPR